MQNFTPTSGREIPDLNVSTTDSGVVHTANQVGAVGGRQNPVLDEEREPSRRGVVVFGGDKTKRIFKENEIKEYPAFERCLSFFRDMGLDQIESMDYLPETGMPTHVAISLVWTKKASLQDQLTLMHEKFHPDSPKLLIYCGEGDNSDEFLLEENTLRSAQNNALSVNNFANVFLVYKRGTDTQINRLLRELPEVIGKAEYESYPSGYQCISNVLTETIVESAIIVNGLRNCPLRVEGFPFEQSLLRNNKEMQRVSVNLQSAQAQDQSIILGGAVRESSYENKLDGHVLIISNEKFSNDVLRMSARMDVENLLFLFKTALGYAHVEVARNLPAVAMRTKIKSFSDQEEHGSFGIVVILTHGSHEVLLGTDLKGVMRRDLVDIFADSKKLAGKPKLLLIDACRFYGEKFYGEKNGGLSLECQDAIPDSVEDMTRQFGKWYLAADRVNVKDNSPNRSGLIVGYSTSPNGASCRLPISGSRFIGSLCWVYCTRASKTDVVSMIAEVNYTMAHFTDVPRPGAVLTGLDMQVPSWTVQTMHKFFLTKLFSPIPEGREVDEGNQRDFYGRLFARLAAIGESPRAFQEQQGSSGDRVFQV